MIKYELQSEGKIIYGEDKNGEDFEIHCGEFFIHEIEVTLDEDGDVEDQEIIEGFVDSIMLEDKWGEGEREIINPYDYEVEFTNGLCHWGYFDTLEEAQKAMNSHKKGEVSVEDILNEYEEVTNQHRLETLANEIESNHSRDEIIDIFDQMIKNLQEGK